MMITKQNIMNNPKAIKNYCLRVLLFLFLLRDSILANFVIILMPIFSAFFSIFNIDPFLDMGLFALSADIFFLYCFAIITGIFKKLEKLNFVSAFISICIVNVLLNYSSMFQIQLFPLKIAFVKQEMTHTLLILYLLHATICFLRKRLISNKLKN